MRPAVAGDPPGPKAVDHANDREIPIEKDGIDREEHERRVDGRRRLEQKTLAGGEISPPQQTLEAPEGPVRDDAPLAYDLAAAPLDDGRHARHG
jgi:hypothetical protein